MPFGVAQIQVLPIPVSWPTCVIRGFMPLGVAQKQQRQDMRNGEEVIRGFMPLGVAQSQL